MEGFIEHRFKILLFQYWLDIASFANQFIKDLRLKRYRLRNHFFVAFFFDKLIQYKLYCIKYCLKADKHHCPTVIVYLPHRSVDRHIWLVQILKFSVWIFGNLNICNKIDSFSSKHWIYVAHWLYNLFWPINFQFSFDMKYRL